MATTDNGSTRFIDSHAHLSDSAFSGDRDEVISRAREAGAEAVIAIGSALDAMDSSEELARQNSGFVFWTSGVHPHDASRFDRMRDIARIEEGLNRGAVAIGECGLDYHYDNSPRDVQRSVFAAQVELSAKTKKPLVVHTRDAESDTGEMIREASAAGAFGVLHCFTGSAHLAATALERGWYVSFSGIVTFKAWKNDDVIRLVPPDRILAESDSPYLAPVPHRGKRNEPSWVSFTVARLAEVRGVSASQMGAQCSANARKLFGLPVKA